MTNLFTLCNDKYLFFAGLGLDDPVEDLALELQPDQVLRGGLRGAVDLGHPAVG